MNAVDADSCSECGKFLSANERALKHGLYRANPSASLAPDLEVSVDSFRDALVSAMGGLQVLEEEPQSAALIRIAVNTDVLARLARDVIVRKSLESKVGRSAADLLLAAADRQMRALQLLGLERRSKPVQSLADYLARRAQQAGSNAPTIDTDREEPR
jgi:hypothetical protein